jgi:hypothetical protein
VGHQDIGTILDQDGHPTHMSDNDVIEAVMRLHKLATGNEYSFGSLARNQRFYPPGA